MSRIRNARERVERLTENPVAPPPDALAFAVRMATAAEEASATGVASATLPAVQLSDVRVGDRLHLGSLGLGRRGGFSSPAPTARGRRPC